MFRRHAALKWTALALGIVALAVMLFLAFADWDALRPVVARLITHKTGRPAAIGHLSVQPWSLNPTLSAEAVSLDNPDWADRKRLFTVDRMVIQVSLLHLLAGKLVLPRVELVTPVVNLERDAKGRASWDFGTPSSGHLPAVRRFMVSDGKVHVVDQIRRLSFDGALTAGESAGGSTSGGGAAFQLHCQGHLNERPFALRVSGGPLLNVDPDEPYEFTATLTAGHLSLDVQGAIPKPFDLGAYSGKFTVSGDDLANAYYLTNLALPNTAKYRISGSLNHSGDKFEIHDLKGRVGASDLEADLTVLTDGPRPKLLAQLKSSRLNLADLAPALGHVPANDGPSDASQDQPQPGVQPPAAAQPAADLLPDADLQVNRVRGMDADVTFDAAAVIATKTPLKQVKFHLQLKDGVMRFDPLSFAMDQGEFSGGVVIDASSDVPESTIDMSLQNVNLAEFKSASGSQPPLEGKLEGRVKLHGFGTSVHKFASSADGTLSLAVPHGEIRSVFAELTGVNVARGLGLLLTGDRTETNLRCGVADFQARQGHLDAKTLVIDTTNVLITGGGSVDLRTEKLNLSIQGDPKKLRLVRLHTPIEVGGTLAKPSVGLQPQKGVLQAGAATALGALLTPVAAVLAFIDPGLAKNADCATLLAQAAPAAPDTARR
jgi:uncharacterized protein involved in outer membrane biogenesis